MDTINVPKLTMDGVLKILQAAINKAKEMGVPQCIAVVDDGGNLLGFIKMDGAKFLSIKSCINKAIAAASIRIPTGNHPEDLGLKLALATEGMYTNLKGGLPIIIDGYTVGGIGVGSGTGEQDLEVAKAAIAVLSK